MGKPAAYAAATASVAKLREAKSLGFRGMILAAYPSGGPKLSLDDDPFWAAAEEEGAGEKHPGAGDRRGRGGEAEDKDCGDEQQRTRLPGARNQQHRVVPDDERLLRCAAYVPALLHRAILAA